VGDGGTVFPGAPAEWTADQRRLVSMTKEYSAAFSTLSIRGHKTPKKEILENYRRFREWWDDYQKDPEIADDPYDKYQFSTRKI